MHDLSFFSENAKRKQKNVKFFEKSLSIGAGPGPGPGLGAGPEPGLQGGDPGGTFRQEGPTEGPKEGFLGGPPSTAS